MEPVKQHNRDVDHHMYGTWRNLCGLQRARPWEPAFAPRQGWRRHEATCSMELHTCTTRTRTTLSNCNCEISMAEAMGISHCAKTGVSTTVKTATAELRHLSLTNNAQQQPCPRTALEQKRAGPWGAASAPQQECLDNPVRRAGDRSNPANPTNFPTNSIPSNSLRQRW